MSASVCVTSSDDRGCGAGRAAPVARAGERRMRLRVIADDVTVGDELRKTAVPREHLAVHEEGGSAMPRA